MMGKESEAGYRELVECQQDLMVKFSPEGRLLFVNMAYCETLGKPREQLVGGVFMPVSGERYTEVLATQMTKLFRPPHACVVEQWLQTEKGMRCISWSAKSVLNGDGRVVSVVATGRDITRAKQEQKAVRKRDDDLMLVLESGKEMYYLHTPDNVMQYVSPRICSLLKIKGRAGRKSWTESLTDHPLNAQGLERTKRAVASGRCEPPYRLELLAADGTKVWVEINEIPVVRHNRTVAIAGSLTDVTEKMQVEEAEAEAALLMKGAKATQMEMKRVQGAPGGFIRSLFSKENDGEDEVVA